MANETTAEPLGSGLAHFFREEAKNARKLAQEAEVAGDWFAAALAGFHATYLDGMARDTELKYAPIRRGFSGVLQRSSKAPVLQQVKP